MRSFAFDPRSRPQSWPVGITIFEQKIRSYVRPPFCPSVRPSQNFKIKQQSLPAGSVGWPSGSLTTPCLIFLCFLAIPMLAITCHLLADKMKNLATIVKKSLPEATYN